MAVNQKILMNTHRIDAIAVVLVILSMLAYFISVLIESNIQFFRDLYGVFTPLMIYPNTYLILLMVVTVTFMSEKLIQHVGIALQ